jgi:hypothetical protein
MTFLFQIFVPYAIDKPLFIKKLVYRLIKLCFYHAILRIKIRYTDVHLF